MAVTTDAPSRKRGFSWKHVLVIVPVVSTFGIAGAFFHELREHGAYEIKRSQDDLNSQIDLLRARDTDSVYLYETHRTDALLQQLRGMPEIRSLRLDLTDVSDDGIDHIASLPNLRTLVVYGGRPGLGNAGLARLSRAARLDTLELVNTHVTNDGLSALRDFSNLRVLKLCFEAQRGERFTDDAFEHLRDLQDVQELELGGGWASDAMVSDLEAALPDCEVVTSRTP